MFLISSSWTTKYGYVKCFGETNLEKKREYTYLYYTEKKREKEREQMEEKKPAASGVEIQGL